MTGPSAVPNSVMRHSGLQWTAAGRALAFVLASTSIWCLLADFYGLCPMRPFVLYILLPTMLLLAGLALADRRRGRGDVYRGVLIGAVAGLIAAVAYDVFRLPFVFAEPLGLDSVVPPMKLFKVFPRFGAMILGEPIEQPAYSLTAHVLGWSYHFSNGVTFGVMYMALIGEGARRHWLWGVVFAAGLEAAMLLTPYSRVFSIHVTGTFIAVTLAAHVVFGAVMGWLAWRLARAWPVRLRGAAMG